MEATIKFLCLLFFLGLIGQGNCQCSLSQTNITQSKTGEVVQGKPVWRVSISSGCACSQSALRLGCNGFQTVKPVDPSLLSKSGDECLVNNGQPVWPPSYTPLNFTYAWDTPFPFRPLSSQMNCS